MDLSRLMSRAKELLGRRGGTQSLKEDAQELRDISSGPGTATDKAKQAYEAVKDPGAPGEPEPRAPREPDPPA